MARIRRIEHTEGVESEIPDTRKSFPADGANVCPHCNKLPDQCFKVGDSKYQVPCPGCGMSGPVEKSIKGAVGGWNSIPRGRPPIYEQIRVKALRLIDEGLDVYINALENHVLTDRDCEAIARMLEAATMSVDTWEL